jgi:hypothetical protein
MSLLEQKTLTAIRRLSTDESTDVNYTQVAYTATQDISYTLLAENNQRAGAIIHNDTDKRLVLGFGSMTVGENNFTVYLSKGDMYETAFGFKGIIKAYSPAAVSSGNVLVTEFIDVRKT